MLAYTQTYVLLGSKQNPLQDKQAAGVRLGCGTVLANIAATKSLDIQMVKTNVGYGGYVFHFSVVEERRTVLYAVATGPPSLVSVNNGLPLCFLCVSSEWCKLFSWKICTIHFLFVSLPAQ